MSNNDYYVPAGQHNYGWPLLATLYRDKRLSRGSEQAAVRFNAALNMYCLLTEQPPLQVGGLLVAQYNGLRV